MWTNDFRESLHGRLLASFNRTKAQVRGILHSKTKTEHGAAKPRGSKCSHCTLLTGLVVFIDNTERK